MQTYTLPFPPTVNTYWRSVIIKGKVRVLLSREGRQYRQDALAALVGAAKAPPGRLAVEVDLHPPDRRSFDVDNRSKGLLDALTHAGVWSDDAVVDRLTITRMGTHPGGRVVVRIAPWEDNHAD